ncbi:hypothetical protein KJ682_14195, partial [bacterium]|nr:hypothetical protein [bacterium]
MVTNLRDSLSHPYSFLDEWVYRMIRGERSCGVGMTRQLMAATLVLVLAGSFLAGPALAQDPDLPLRRKHEDRPPPAHP